MAVVSEPSRPQRRGLLSTIGQSVRGDYVRAARTLGRLDVDVVLLQHEYGIFGGADGEYVLSFAEELAQPLVVTLHTVLSTPSPHQLEVLTDLCGHAELVIVMTETARRLLVECDACPEEKIRVVPHGAPTRLTARSAGAASGPYARADERFLLSTFGLISPGKGLETVIEALPSMLERHPEISYVIAGRTHPDIAHREGEQYRVMLEQRVLELGVEEHVEFDDRFLTIDELSDLLSATDVFVTPYRSQEQISSGALTFAIAAGCGIVSTPYWYAQDMLASGAGRLVPFDDPAALADAVCAYIDEPDDAGRRARRGPADRLLAHLAFGREGDRGRAARGARARPATAADGGRRSAADEPAHRPPAHAGRRRRHRAARARDHPEPRERLLRRRRRAARGGVARARAAGRRAGLDRRSSTGRSRSCMPQRARAACATS